MVQLSSHKKDKLKAQTAKLIVIKHQSIKELIDYLFFFFFSFPFLLFYCEKHTPANNSFFNTEMEYCFVIIVLTFNFPFKYLIQYCTNTKFRKYSYLLKKVLLIYS